MKTVSVVTSKAKPSVGFYDIHINSFPAYLRNARYAERTIRKKRSIVKSFTVWAVIKKIAPGDLEDSHLLEFTQRRFQTKQRTRFELAALRLFIKYLRDISVTPRPAEPININPVDSLRRRYTDYLRNERGLAENSIRAYSLIIKDFLNEQTSKKGCVSPDALNSLMIGDFLCNYSRSRSKGTTHIMAAALRSFFRFLYRHEETVIDFSRSVPSVSRSCQPELPAFLLPQDVERVLSIPDLSTPRGRRDHAILLLLARLGLRAGEVVSMELDDICWRTGEVLIRGKGKIMDRLPLLLEIGEAIAIYLKKDRGDSVSRKVFLRMIAPRIGLAGPAAIGHIVRLSLVRAGIHLPGRGAAHVFRHSLATKMIRNGASLFEISQVMRHRSIASTVLYAKVDFETLKGVTSPWPVKGGVR